MINLYSPNININAGAIIDASQSNVGKVNIIAGKDSKASLITVLNPGASVDLGGNKGPAS